MTYGTLSERTIELVEAYLKENKMNMQGYRNNVTGALEALRKHVNDVYGPEKSYFDIIETRLLEVTEYANAMIFTSGEYLKRLEGQYQEGYEDGKQEGLEQGYEEGYEEADGMSDDEYYDQGYEDGMAVGFKKGYDKGLNEKNQNN